MGQSPRIDELKRRVRMDPASIAFAALAEEYRRAGQFDEAIETCTAGLRRHPAYPSAHITLGRALAAKERVSEARAQFEYVLALAPENLAAIGAMAEIHTLGDTAAAREPASDDVSTRPHETPEVVNYVQPALGGLEVFLEAIARARTARADAR